MRHGPDPGDSGNRPARSWAGTALARLTGGSTVITTGLVERRNERLKARRRLTRRRVVKLAVAAAVAGLLAALVLATPLLALRSEDVSVAISGPTVDAAAVSAVVDPAVGTPLALLDVSAMAAAVRQVPGVLRVEVRRDWPNGLSVDVTARQPVAAVPRDGRLVLLDRDGVQVGEPLVDPPPGLPVVQVPIGEHSGEALRAVLTVLGILEPQLLAEVTQAGAASPDAVWFTVAGGGRVEWGSTDSPALKTRVLEVLRQRPAAVYDVSAPAMPVTR